MATTADTTPAVLIAAVARTVRAAIPTAVELVAFKAVPEAPTVAAVVNELSQAVVWGPKHRTAPIVAETAVVKT
jgi:hypothetical protein